MTLFWCLTPKQRHFTLNPLKKKKKKTLKSHIFFSFRLLSTSLSCRQHRTPFSLSLSLKFKSESPFSLFVSSLGLVGFLCFKVKFWRRSIWVLYVDELDWFFHGFLERIFRGSLCWRLYDVLFCFFNVSFNLIV
jgi:hypothetical protein